MYTFLFSALGANTSCTCIYKQAESIKLNLLNNLLPFKNKFKDFRPHKSIRMDTVFSQSEFKDISPTQWWNLILLMERQWGAPNLI